MRQHYNPRMQIISLIMYLIVLFVMCNVALSLGSGATSSASMHTPHHGYHYTILHHGASHGGYGYYPYGLGNGGYAAGYYNGGTGYHSPTAVSSSNFNMKSYGSYPVYFLHYGYSPKYYDYSHYGDSGIYGHANHLIKYPTYNYKSYGYYPKISYDYTPKYNIYSGLKSYAHNYKH